MKWPGKGPRGERGPMASAGLQTSSIRLAELSVRAFPHARRIAETTSLALAYALAGLIGTRLAISPGSATAMWPPSGIALAAVLRRGPRAWQGIWLGAFVATLATLFAHRIHDQPALSVMGASAIATGAALQALVGARLLHRASGRVDPLARAADVVRLVTLGGLASCTINASVGMSSMLLGGFLQCSHAARMWWTWWVGDVGGVLVMTPLLLVCTLRSARRAVGETVVLVALILAVGALVFGEFSPFQRARYPIEHVFLPALVGAVLWMGSWGAVLAIFVTSTVATWATAHGLGPFAVFPRLEALVLVQGFVLGTAVPTLALAAVLNERRRAEGLLARARDELEDRVEARTAELRASEERHRTLIELSPDAIFVLGGDRIVYANTATAHLLGAGAAEELVGARVLDLVHPSYRELAAQRVRALREGGEPAPLTEMQLVRRDGSVVDIEASWASLASQVAVEPGGMVMARDVTARRQLTLERSRLYREAQESIRARDDFLCIASHELKTPLTSLLLQAQAMSRAAKREGARPEQLTPSCDMIVRQVRRLEVLVDGLLDVSRVAQDRLVLVREAVELPGLVREVAARFAPEAARAGCAVSLRVEAEVTGFWDRKRLEQVTEHLVSNALKYGASKPVEIALAEASGVAILSVKDHGIGISEDHQARIFDRFERAVSTRHYAGFGLGLWLTRRIVEALGGRITVESEAGAGSTFTVELPVGLVRGSP